MDIRIKEVNIERATDSGIGVIILPENYLSDSGYQYASSTLSFYKYAQKEIEVRYLTRPEAIVDKRSVEWFGPVLLITSVAFNENPEIVSITCGVIANYVTDFFKGKTPPKIKLKVVYKETDSTKSTEIEYEGEIEGLEKLSDAILEVVRNKK